MLQQIIFYIGTLDTTLVYIVLFFFSFLENIFPPSPSDIVVVFGATLIAKSAMGFIPILIVTSAGSALGFIVMFYLGRYLGDKLIRTGKFKFIKEESLAKADQFFHKYGYKIIIINRFLPGTRAVVSFFCGFHKLKPVHTFIYAAASSFFWNILLISLGVALGHNLELIDYYLEQYSKVILIVMIVAAAFFIVRFIIKKKNK
jgi:membrane protein DedA with SNARE-associated domain